MSFTYPAAMRRLINELTKLPSVGERSATRLAYYLVANADGRAQALAEAIQQAVEQTKLCDTCYFFCEAAAAKEPSSIGLNGIDDVESGEIEVSQCAICSDGRRERNLLCVVEKPADVFALERSGSFRGLYHVLHGVWSPLRGIRPEQTKVPQLLDRLRGERQGDPLVLPLSELILATSTTIDGEATALFIARELEGSEIHISRIGQGLPKGGELEFADELTLAMSLQGRRDL